MSDEEIVRISHGAEAEGWTDHERALIRAVDELRRDAFIHDATWAKLAENYSTQQLMDVVFTVGEYNLVSMALRTFGVQREEGVEGFPDWIRAAGGCGEEPLLACQGARAPIGRRPIKERSRRRLPAPRRAFRTASAGPRHPPGSADEAGPG